MEATDAKVSIIYSMLEGCQFANARRRSGALCRIALPTRPSRRRELIAKHVRGAPATLTFCARGRPPWRERVASVELAAYCPDGGGLCHWLAIDFDATDHGDGGLADAVYAMRVFAERADFLGLRGGLLAAKSRGGQGRHLFLILPRPVPLIDAVIGVASWASSAFLIAARDASENDVNHALRNGAGSVAMPGEAGALELIPRSSQLPQFGWAIAIPAAGVRAEWGGGHIVDAFSDEPIEPEFIPRCNAHAWTRFVEANRKALAAAQRQTAKCKRYKDRRHGRQGLSQRTEDFLEGRTPEGIRNLSAFRAACDLIRQEFGASEVLSLVQEGARRCGLPVREATNAVRSAERTVGRLP